MRPSTTQVSDSTLQALTTEGSTTGLYEKTTIVKTREDLESEATDLAKEWTIDHDASSFTNGVLLANGSRVDQLQLSSEVREALRKEESDAWNDKYSQPKRLWCVACKCTVHRRSSYNILIFGSTLWSVSRRSGNGSIRRQWCADLLCPTVQHRKRLDRRSCQWCPFALLLHDWVLELYPSQSLSRSQVDHLDLMLLRCGQRDFSSLRKLYLATLWRQALDGYRHWRQISNDICIRG